MRVKWITPEPPQSPREPRRWIRGLMAEYLQSRTSLNIIACGMLRHDMEWWLEGVGDTQYIKIMFTNLESSTDAKAPTGAG